MKPLQIPEEKRTTQQNKALHVYFELVAEALNSAGYDIPTILKKTRIDIPWTKESAKELIWKTIQKSMYSKESTTQLSKQQEIDKVYEVVNRFLATLKIESIPFPSDDPVDN